MTLSNDAQTSAFSSGSAQSGQSALDADFQTLSQDLQSGNLSGAQQAFTQAAKDIQGGSDSSSVGGGHHHHRHAEFGILQLKFLLRLMQLLQSLFGSSTSSTSSSSNGSTSSNGTSTTSSTAAAASTSARLERGQLQVPPVP